MDVARNRTARGTECRFGIAHRNPRAWRVFVDVESEAVLDPNVVLDMIHTEYLRRDLEKHYHYDNLIG